MHKYLIDQINVSDKEYELTEINTESSTVKEGELIFSYESSKADFEVFAESNGKLYLNPSAAVGKSYEVGYIVAVVSETEITQNELEQLFNLKHDKTGDTQSRNSDQLVTKKAKSLINKYKIDLDAFADLEVITEESILNHLNKNKLKNQKSKNQIIIVGGRGGCKMIIETIKSIGYFTIKGIIDDNLSINDKVMGIDVLGGQQELMNLFSEGYRNIVLSFTSLSDLKIRESKYYELKKVGFQFPNIIHRSATVEPSVNLGEGNIILANAMVGSDVSLGDINFINTGAILSHDTIVETNNHFAPNAVLAGRITVGKNNLFGMCSTTYFDIEIGNNNTIYNGVNVFANIGDNNILKKN